MKNKIKETLSVLFLALLLGIFLYSAMVAMDFIIFHPAPFEQVIPWVLLVPAYFTLMFMFAIWHDEKIKKLANQ